MKIKLNFIGLRDGGAGGGELPPSLVRNINWSGNFYGGLSLKISDICYFLNIHQASPNTDHNIICMFLKRKTILKPEKSSLSNTNQGKTTILPRANNGIQLVYSIVCNFNGIVLFNFSNTCVNFKVDYLEECLTHFQKFS